MFWGKSIFPTFAVNWPMPSGTKPPKPACPPEDAGADVNGLSISALGDRMVIYTTTEGGGVGVAMSYSEARRFAHKLVAMADEFQPPEPVSFGYVESAWGNASKIRDDTA